MYFDLLLDILEIILDMRISFKRPKSKHQGKKKKLNSKKESQKMKNVRERKKN